MIDLAQKASVENAIYWYRMSYLFLISIQIIDYVGEIVLAHRDPTQLPILIYLKKANPTEDEYKVNLQAITWPDEISTVSFYHKPYLGEPQSVGEMMEADHYYDRPFERIMQEITGDVDVVGVMESGSSLLPL